MALQLSSTNGPPARALFSCRYLAISSLPEPVSPWSSTVDALARAARSSRDIACLRPSLEPTISTRPAAPWRRRVTSWRSRACSSARSSTTPRWSRSGGLSMKSYAPSWMARTACSTVPCPVSITTGSVGSASRSSRSTRRPSSSASFRSRTTASTPRSRTASSASLPLAASTGT